MRLYRVVIISRHNALLSLARTQTPRHYLACGVVMATKGMINNEVELYGNVRVVMRAAVDLVFCRLSLTGRLPSHTHPSIHSVVSHAASCIFHIYCSNNAKKHGFEEKKIKM